MSQTDKNFSNIDAHVEDGKQLGAIVFPAGSIYNAVLDFSQQIGWNIQKSGRISINRIVQTGTLTKPNTPRAIPLRMKNSAIIDYSVQAWYGRESVRTATELQNNP